MAVPAIAMSGMEIAGVSGTRHLPPKFYLKKERKNGLHKYVEKMLMIIFNSQRSRTCGVAESNQTMVFQVN